MYRAFTRTALMAMGRLSFFRGETVSHPTCLRHAYAKIHQVSGHGIRESSDGSGSPYDAEGAIEAFQRAKDRDTEDDGSAFHTEDEEL
jgi:hypothetical protein